MCNHDNVLPQPHFSVPWTLTPIGDILTDVQMLLCMHGLDLQLSVTRVEFCSERSKFMYCSLCNPLKLYAVYWHDLNILLKSEVLFKGSGKLACKQAENETQLQSAVIGVLITFKYTMQQLHVGWVWICGSKNQWLNCWSMKLITLTNSWAELRWGHSYNLLSTATAVLETCRSPLLLVKNQLHRNHSS